MDVSIVICTFNRAEELALSLATHAALTVPPGVEWEILVVDNNSTDHTPEVVARFEGQLPVRRVFETRQGHSNALNRGFAEARGALVLMTDDDVDVTPGWLAAYAAAAQNFPEASFFGGKIVTQWQEPPPVWLAMNADWLTSTPVLDWGAEPKALTKESRAYVIGANMAIRRAVVAEGFQFREDLGCIGSDLDDTAQHGGQEGEWERRALAAGKSGQYVPDAVVHHRERAYRGTRRYVRWYYRNMGVETRRREGLPAGATLLNVPRYLWKRLLLESAQYFYHRLASSPRVWLKADCQLSRTKGEIQECRRLAGERGKAQPA